MHHCREQLAFNCFEDFSVSISWRCHGVKHINDPKLIFDGWEWHVIFHHIMWTNRCIIRGTTGGYLCLELFGTAIPSQEFFLEEVLVNLKKKVVTADDRSVQISRYDSIPPTFESISATRNSPAWQTCCFLVLI